MYEDILKDQLKKLQEYQKVCKAESAEFIHLSAMIQDTARKIQALEEEKSTPKGSADTVKITLDGNTLADILECDSADEEEPEDMYKKELKEQIGVLKRSQAHLGEGESALCLALSERILELTGELQELEDDDLIVLPVLDKPVNCRCAFKQC